MSERMVRKLSFGLCMGAFFIALTVWGVQAGVICSTSSEEQTCQGENQ